MQLPTLDEPSRVKASSAATTEWLEAARSGVINRLSAFELSPLLLGAADRSGWTAMHWCAARDNTNALSWLIDAGAPVMARTAAGYTALTVAAHKGHSACIAVMLRTGPCESLTLLADRSGLTPLHHAAASADVESVQRLLAAGVSLTHIAALKNRDNSTPQAIAARVAATATGGRQRQSTAVLKLLEGESKRLHRWFRAARVCDLSTIEAMLDAPEQSEQVGTPLVNACDSSGMTALLSVVRCGRVDAALVLLRHGANVRHRDSSGRTALHHLAAVALLKHGLGGLLQQLLRAGANALALDGGGRTALQTCEMFSGRVSTQVQVRDGLCAADALARRMRRWRAVGRVAGLLVTWHRGAVERAYAPGGVGYLEAEADFGAAAKVQRTK